MGRVFRTGAECGRCREANVNVVGDRMPMLGEVNESAISIEK